MKQWQKINQAPGVLKAEESAARRIAARATAISRAEGGAANYTVRQGTRPGGRTYFDVVSDRPDEEFGTESTQRINALRRAVRGG